MGMTETRTDEIPCFFPASRENPDRTEACDHAARRVHTNFAGIEHAETENVAILDRAGADDLGKEADPDAHQLAGLATGEGFPIATLLIAQRRHNQRWSGPCRARSNSRRCRIPTRAPIDKGIVLCGSGSDAALPPGPYPACAPEHRSSAR